MAAQITLTDAKLQGLKLPSAGQHEISDAKVPGLRVRIGKSGVKTLYHSQKSWRQFAEHHGGPVRTTLGACRCTEESQSNHQ